MGEADLMVLSRAQRVIMDHGVGFSVGTSIVVITSGILAASTMSSQGGRPRTGAPVIAEHPPHPSLPPPSATAPRPAKPPAATVPVAARAPAASATHPAKRPKPATAPRTPAASTPAKAPSATPTAAKPTPAPTASSDQCTLTVKVLGGTLVKICL
jgi:hypothetical protein